MPDFAARLQHGPLAPALALVAGIAAALGFAPIGIFAFTLFGLAVLIVLAEAAPRRAPLLGWTWGLGHFAFGCRWIAEAFAYQDKMPHWLGWVAVVGLAALLATMPAIACALTWRILYAPPTGGRDSAEGAGSRERDRRARAPERPPVGVPRRVDGDRMGARALVHGLPVEHACGLHARSARPAAGGCHLGRARPVGADRARRRAAIAFARWRPGLVAVVLVGIGAAAGGVLATRAKAPVAELVIVQPNIGQAEKWEPAAQERDLAKLMRLSHPAAAARPGVPRVILWPEVALAQGEPGRDPALRARLATLLRPGDLLITGALSADWNAAGEPVTARNSVFVIDAAARILARYDKFHLVPGGEYVPLRPLADAIGLSRLSPGDIDFTPGPGPRTVALPGLPSVGPLVCYEMIFPTDIVDEAHRPAWLFNPSNDAWFADTGPWQHLALARLRAIEEGLPVARSTPTGVSALIGPDGALLATVPQRAQGAIVMQLPAVASPYPLRAWGRSDPARAGRARTHRSAARPADIKQTLYPSCGRDILALGGREPPVPEPAPCAKAAISSPPNRFPKVTPTRSPTRFRTRWSICF